MINKDVSNRLADKQSTEEILSRCSLINERGDLWDSQGFNPFHTPFDGYKKGRVTIGDDELIMSGSYSYLGLSQDKRILDAVQDAIANYGASSHGSRALTGSMSAHENLERSLANFMGTKGCTIFSNGFLTNYATITTLVGPGDSIITEITNHSSIQAGVTASGASIYSFRMNYLATLRHALEKAKGSTTFVVADAVFSMEGSILPLPEVVELCNEYGAFLMIDEAHSFGVLGATGRGIVEHFGMEPDCVDLRMGTMSKSLTSVGGFIVGDPKIAQALSQGSNGYLFTAAQPIALVAAAQTSLEILDNEPEIVESLQAKATHLRKLFLEADLPVWGAQAVPIIPVVYDSQEVVFEITKQLFENKVFVVPAVYPAVSKKTPRIRFSVTDDHSYEDLNQIADVFIRINDDLNARVHSVIDLDRLD